MAEQSAKTDLGRLCPDPFLIVDEDTGEKYYGGSQSWFGRNSMTFAGCGIIAAANTVRALLCRYPGAYREARGNLKTLGNVILTKAEYIKVIESMYRRMFVAELPLLNLIYDKGNYKYGSRLLGCVPPSLGMNSESLVRGLLRYAENRGVLLHDVYLSAAYVEYRKGLEFIREGLDKNGALILLTSFNRHPVTLYRGNAWDISGGGYESEIKTHFSTITDIIEENGEPLIKLSTWGRAATVPYRVLHAAWQKRLAYVSALIYFVPKRSRALYRADMRKTALFTPISTLQSVLGRRFRS